MRYDLHLLEGSEIFEDLVICVCKNILGISSHKFSTGPDGGRDSKFEGTASSYPSLACLWSGKFIIQAKFTNNANGSCSDPSFKKLLENEELPRVKKLIESKDIDNYLIFTNRKLTAKTHFELQEWLRREIGINNIDLHGQEDINLWITSRSDIIEQFSLNRNARQIRFYEKDIKDIILAFSENKVDISTFVEENFDFSEKFLNKEEKNRKNNLSHEYFDYIKSNSLAYFNNINKFLNDPKNSKLLDSYKTTIQELQHKILIKRNDFEKFEELFDVLYDYVLEKNDGKIKEKRNLILVFLHFMYFNCDIGIK